MGGPSPSSIGPDSVTSNAIGLSNAQMPFSEAAQAASNYNQSNYYGGLQYKQTGTGPGGVPLYTAVTNYSPNQKALADIYTGGQGIAGVNADQLLAGAGYGNMSPASAIGNINSGLTGGVMNAETHFLDPFFQIQHNQLDTQLQNQGFTPGTTAYNNAMMPQTTGQDLAVSNFLAGFAPTALNQATTEYQLPLTMGQQLAQWGAPISPTSQYSQNNAQFTGPNVNNAANVMSQSAVNQFQAEQAQNNAMLNGLFGIGAAGLKAFA